MSNKDKQYPNGYKGLIGGTPATKDTIDLLTAETEHEIMCDVCGGVNWKLVADKDGNVHRADCRNTELGKCNNNHILLQMKEKKEVQKDIEVHHDGSDGVYIKDPIGMHFEPAKYIDFAFYDNKDPTKMLMQVKNTHETQDYYKFMRKFVSWCRMLFNKEEMGRVLAEKLGLEFTFGE